MKKVFLTTVLILAVVFAFAVTRDDIRTQITQPENAKPLNTVGAKDSTAIEAGGKAIFELSGDMRGFAPTPLTSMHMAPDGSNLQVICALANGVGVFEGVYYTLSTDGGANFSSPTRISAANSWLRNYNSLAVDPTGYYPYVVLAQYNATTYSCGDWFTTDMLGPGGGNWNTPILISDTVNNGAYMPTVAVNSDGSKVAYLAYDLIGGYGVNVSGDFGTTWGTYGLDATLSDTTVINGPDVSALRWGTGDNVHAILGTMLKGTYWSDILGSGAGTAINITYAVSADAGASYGPMTKMFDGEALPDIASINGDTMVYYIDTLDNGSVDMLPVNAYLDTTTGGWTDELDQTLADGFGTWWYWWDAEAYHSDEVYMAIPYADLFADYYNSGSKLFTWVWQGQSIMLGHYDGSAFTWIHVDVHDADVLDSNWTTATWRGNAYSTNVVKSQTDGYLYIPYIDYVDTATGVSSVELLRWDTAMDSVWRAATPPILNAGLYEVEAANMTDASGIIHIAGVSGSEDSIYYWAVDPSTISDWEGIAGIEDKNVTADTDMFNVPSIIRDNGEISFSIANTGNVRVSLYDVTGREVMNLLNREFSAGTHKVNISANTLSQGVYFATIMTDKGSDSKKVIIVK